MAGSRTPSWSTSKGSGRDDIRRSHRYSSGAVSEPTPLLVRVDTHGRCLVAPPDGDGPWPVLMGFHGYAESAAVHAPQLARLDPHHRWVQVSVQGLHRFYSRTQQVVASWMTREDRDVAIGDNIAYGAAVRDAVARDHPTRAPLVVVGFSQGVAQAYRVALAAGAACRGVIALGGDLPPDVAPRAASLPPVLIGRGSRDEWYSSDALAADVETLRAARVTFAVCEFDGGHEWAEVFVAAASAWLAARDA